MSSVTRFLKQVDPASTYLTVGNTVTSSTSSLYEFVPSAGNVVGNYPPGYMVAATAPLVAALNQAFNAGGASLVLRDMGKTIAAPVSSLTGVTGRFRQVQVLLPGSISASQGFIGGPAGNTFGVLGAAATPDAYTNYLTAYIAVPVGGVLGGTLSTASVIGGAGQM
jgi:hypothetical protein